jgi:hypothetical protein
MKFSLERFKNPRVTDNFHILFWLVKDTSWVMEFKLLGVSMIIPTIAIAIFICYKTFKTADFFVNLAVLFWVSANSFWMCAEFYNFLQLKNYTAIPFALGFISFGIYLYKLIKPGDTNTK